jgi:two-component system, NarL family, response regulator LiaR
MSTRKIRVLVADDHVMVRTGLSTMLRIFDDLVLVGEAANGQIAIDMCAELMPDLVLMDINMPTLDGVAATRVIRQNYPEIKVIALTAYVQDSVTLQALQAGASGYVLKSVSPDELVTAIHSVFAGQITLSPQAAQSLMQAHSKPATGFGLTDFGLTEREQEVLHLMIAGMGNTAIAERLHVSPLTVKTHVSNILSKMNVSTRAEAVALATQRISHP